MAVVPFTKKEEEERHILVKKNQVCFSHVKVKVPIRYL